MRRRPNQPKEPSDSSIDPETAMSNLIKTKPMDIATSIEVESKKPFSVCPRNYDPRRKYVILASFMLAALFINFLGKSLGC